jgi:ABC-type multidrug transport system fused ATPase/permease subunit
MISTQSTTGYIGTIVLYSFFAFKKFDLQYILAFVIFVVPVAYQLSKLDFMREKIEEQFDIEDDLQRINESMDYANKVKRSNEYVGSLARFPSMYYELINIEKDPILGYGRNAGRSYFSQRISGNFVLTSGLLKIFGQFGIPLGLLIFLILYRSSAALGRDFKVRKSVLFIIMLIALTSYTLFITPIIMAFWFYGLFRKKDDLLITVTETTEEVSDVQTTDQSEITAKE